MADAYVDLSAPGNEYQAYAATPTWGALSTDKPLPMDGNGKAGPGHSAAVAIAEIQITVLPGDTNTLVIAGATLTAKTTPAAKNQWAIGGSIATCVSNLVALLNTFGTGTSQCDAAVSTSACALALALPYWQFARVKPGTTDTLQIATRIAGSDLNYSGGTNAYMAITTAGWGTPPTITQFAGGADGPFAYLLNTTTIFGKSDGQTGTAGPGYGLYFNASPAPFDPGTSDATHVRTKRGGSNLSVTWNSTGTASAAWKQRNYIFDDGTVWSGDNGKLTTTFKNSNGSSTGSIFTLAASGTLGFSSRGKDNYEVQCGVTASGSGSFVLVACGAGAKFSFKRCRYVETSDNIRSISLVTDGGASITWFVDLSDSFVQLRTSVAGKPVVSVGGSGTAMRVVLNGLTVEVVAASANIGKFIGVQGSANTGTVEWIGGEVRDSLGVYRCPMPFDIHAGSALDSIIDGVVGVTNPSVGMTASATVNARFRWSSPEGPNKGFRTETPRYSVDWQGDGTFPYCGAAADLRGVGWSHRFTWGSIPSAWAPVTILKLSRFYRSAAAAKTIIIELNLPTTTTVYLDEMELTVSYLDSTDVWRTESVGGARGLQFAASRTALSSSSASWTAVSGYGAKKIELTTAYPIKQGSEVIARLTLCASRGSSLTGYVSPELGFA